MTKTAEKPTKYVYSWKHDKKDERDFLFTRPSPLILPSHADLRAHCSPVDDQGPLGSCVAHAVVGALEYLEIKTGAQVYVNLSRLFLYYQARVIEGTVDQDAGAEIRDGVKAAAKVGVCKETLEPYNIAHFKSKPSKHALEDAATRKILDYQRVLSLLTLKAAIANGYPVAFGFTVYEQFESDEVAKTGVANYPTANERPLGGHAVLAVGYDDDSQRIIVRNSWGKHWGMKGYFTLPYQYIEDKDLSDDFWIVRK